MLDVGCWTLDVGCWILQVWGYGVLIQGLLFFFFKKKTYFWGKHPDSVYFARNGAGKAAAEGCSKPVQPPSTNVPRDEISRSGESLTPIYTYIKYILGDKAWGLQNRGP